MTMGIFILGFVPVGYFIMEAFFQTLVKAKLRQNSIQQWIRVITSIALGTCLNEFNSDPNILNVTSFSNIRVQMK